MRLRILIALSLLSLVSGCHRDTPAQAPVAAPTPAALEAHSDEFKQQVVKVTDGVWVAIGYGIANSILLEGDDGVVIVDTMETREAAEQVRDEFRKISDKPVKAIIYTHSHPDHIGGAAVFGGPGIPVIAQAEVAANMDKIASQLQPVITRRSLRMYGSQLPQGERVNIGIGGFLALDAGSSLDTLRPTQTFADRLDITIAGIAMQLVHAPGETRDQLFVWLPQRGVLLCGDNFYKAFPNLYTIRGTGYRDPRLWADSLDRMRALHATYLVPSHTRPLTGADAIDKALTDYRDAIRYVNDQTLRLMNRGLLPDEIAAQLQLPAHLSASPYLQPFYGKASWSAKAVFDGNLGWYSGDPADLQPLPPDDQARRMVELAGGGAALQKQIDTAMQHQDWQWALQLSGYALRVDAKSQPAKDARIAALRALGGAETNPPARDWYFTAARELSGDVIVPSREGRPTAAMLAGMPLSVFFDGMAVNLHAEDALNSVLKVGFEFSDSGERYTYIVRRGVSELVPGIADDVELQVRVSTQVFKETLAGLRSPALAIASDFEMTRGSKLDFARFMALFTPK
ncbi:alkyl sulfatase dimerization domain-containing protein [Hydrocarboniphaga sp.]|uniref:alkyl sulfatase dimerization domain-containing protein n=1 Tax=Hydrocarboniphaga sp. TaxID=2033016 RepID=UPI003D13C63C